MYGFKFHTNQCDESKRKKNNGVIVRRGGSKLQCALLLTTNKVERNRVVLFKCDWYDLSREGIGYKRDWHGTTIVNTL